MAHQDQTTPPWKRPNRDRPASPLNRDLECDVCVVGAGVAGLSVAYHLGLSGEHVVVIDRRSIGNGESARTTAHLTHALDDRYRVVRRMHGPEGARICAESHTRAIEQIQINASLESIDCEFKRVDGYLFLPPGESLSVLMSEWNAAREAGLMNIEKLPRAPIPDFDTGPCLRFPNQAQVHPARYMAGLADAIRRRGGQIFEDTAMKDIDDRPICVVTDGDRRINCSAIVIATNTPINNRFAVHTKQSAYRTYVVGLRIPRGSVPEALYWDTSQEAGQAETAAYHYIRIAECDGAPGADRLLTEQLLLVGGEDHKTGQADDPEVRWSNLERWARRRFPGAGAVDVRWSGQIWEPVDRLAMIGRNAGGPDHVYIVTGDSGMGMTHGAIAGLLITDLISGRQNPWAKLYDPSRVTLSSLLEYARGNLNIAAHYADWVREGEVSSADGLPCGSGAVVRHGLSLRAVHRDASGVLHERSAVCPHLGCIVHWNSAEHSWDCPCHGSRFDASGEVINGPAVSPLSSTDSPESPEAACAGPVGQANLAH